MKQAKIGKKTLKRLVSFPGLISKSRQWKDKDYRRETATVRCKIYMILYVLSETLFVTVITSVLFTPG
jgi:hypothetical protein